MRDTPSVKLRGREKLALIPIKVVEKPALPKPPWLNKRLTSEDIEAAQRLKATLRSRQLVTVCEEAACPNLLECFGKYGTATFMILGDKCTRRCTFCDVAHGKPLPPDPSEPEHLLQAVRAMGLAYVVITSVDRDDLRDGGAAHFAECIQVLRSHLDHLSIEILVPDFRGRWPYALDILRRTPPDVFNHNVETTERLYRAVRPGSNYQHSLKVLLDFKTAHPHIPTKSGFMVGLGESDEEIEQILLDLRAHQVDRVTIGQYLAPSPHHAPVERYVSPSEFQQFETLAKSIGFHHVYSGPWVRSSYHAQQHHL